ncbi:hypothetical protein J6590_011090 [Homalodisca vitripennis]|nr:hypothetical protein J6590_011090 [Homalodisca vitripennis]
MQSVGLRMRSRPRRENARLRCATPHSVLSADCPVQFLLSDAISRSQAVTFLRVFINCRVALCLVAATRGRLPHGHPPTDVKI